MQKLRNIGMVTQHRVVGGYPDGTEWMVVERLDPVRRVPTLYLRHVDVWLYVGRLRCVIGSRRLSGKLTRNGVLACYRLEAVAIHDLDSIAGRPMFRSAIYEKTMQTIITMPVDQLDAWLSRQLLAYRLHMVTESLAYTMNRFVSVIQSAFRTTNNNKQQQQQGG